MSIQVITTPLLSIVGKTNVGKTTLFNRLIGRKHNVESSFPHTTRDIAYSNIVFGKKIYKMVDTGGIDFFSNSLLYLDVNKQAFHAIQKSNIILFVVDVSLGVTESDRSISDFIRIHYKQPVILIGNKIDCKRDLDILFDCYNIGFGEPVFISSSQGIGINKLFYNIDNTLSLLFKNKKCKNIADHYINSVYDKQFEIVLSVVGRPNVGKSSFINYILGEYRHLVSDESHTTVDTIDSFFCFENIIYKIIDTAGIRKRMNIDKKVEKMAVSRSFSAIDRSHVSLLLIDALQGVVDQDIKIASLIKNKGRPSLLIVNKCDLLINYSLSLRYYRKLLNDDFSFIAYVPIIFISAKIGFRINELFPLIKKVFYNYFIRVKTSDLNNWLRAAMLIKRPPVIGNKQIKIYFISQASIVPPTFILSCNFIDFAVNLCVTYKKFLENKLRGEFDFHGSPIRIYYRFRQKYQ